MEKTGNIKIDVADVLKTVLFATLISLGFVLIFAIIVRFASVPNDVILPVNIAIKILSVFLGVLLSFKNAQNGLLKGAISGLLYMLFTFLIFSALTGFKDVKFSWIDLVTLPVAGAISGIIAVNVRARKAR
ncbi:MAG: TIGR04086 family membrane protein [Christensenellales bacterium]